MKAVTVSPSQRHLGLTERPEPAREGPGAVLARVLEVGICGTDREIARFEYGEPPPGSDCLVIGHESLAEVVAVGPATDGLARGDLVVSMVRRPCDDPGCAPCRAGRQDFCVSGTYTEHGIKGRDGFLTELVVDDARYLIPVPRELRRVGVLTEPLTIVEKALEGLARNQRGLPWTDPDGGRWTTPGARAIVVGAGPIGLLGTMALRSAGFQVTVYSRSRIPNVKADLVEALGATYLSSLDLDLDQVVARVGTADVILEAAGVASAAMAATRLLGPNGVLILTGVPGPEPPAPFDASGLMRRLVLGNQTILGTVNAGRSLYERAVADLTSFHERWPEQLESLITGRHAIEQAPDLLVARSDGIKDVISLAVG